MTCRNHSGRNPRCRATQLGSLTSRSFDNRIARSTQFLWWDIIEDKCNAVFFTLVHHAMSFLIIDFISLTRLQLVRPAIDHEPDPSIGRDRDVYPVTNVERWVCIHMRQYFAASQ